MTNTANDKDLFFLLSDCRITMESHLKNLLLKLGFNNAPALAKLDINEIETLEKTIQKTFASKKALAKLKNEDELIALFGPVFYEEPENFTFLQGEVATIEAAIEACCTMLKQNRIPVMLPKAPVFNNRRIPPKPILKAIVENQTANTDGAANQTTDLNVPKISLKDYIGRWISKNAIKNHFCISITDLEIDESTRQILCTIHDTKATVSVSGDGNWKISNFTRHLKVISQVHNYYYLTNTVF